MDDTVVGLLTFAGLFVDPAAPTDRRIVLTFEIDGEEAVEILGQPLNGKHWSQVLN